MAHEEVTQIFKALSHPSRVELLDYLRDGPKTTGELSEKFNVSRYAVMKHLTVLEEARLILVRRKGRLRLNYLHATPLQEVYNRWVSQYESGIASSLVHLKNIVEEEERRSVRMVGTQEKFDVSSFQIEQEVRIQAPRNKVFKALTEDINKWWAYRLDKERASVLTLEPKINGSFFEDWGNGEGAIWGTVYFYKENEEIRIEGHLGMRGAVKSDFRYLLKEEGTATVLQLSHQAVGLLEPQWEEMHRKGWDELLGTFLKQYVENGTLPASN